MSTCQMFEWGVVLQTRVSTFDDVSIRHHWTCSSASRLERRHFLQSLRHLCWMSSSQTSAMTSAMYVPVSVID